MSQRVSDVRLRSLRERDIPAWVELINATDAADELGRATMIADVGAKLSSPGYGLDHVLLAWQGSHLVGYADLWVQSDGRAIGWVTVLPRARRHGIGRRLLDGLIEMAAKESLYCIDLPIVPRVAGAVELATGADARLARYWWDMLWMGSLPPAAPEPPPGITLRTYRPGADAAAWVDLDAAVFTENWGAAPLTVSDVIALTGRLDFDPAGLWFAADGGKLVGQALARIHSQKSGDADRPVGRVDDLGVLPAYRGRGIGRALLLTAMRYLWDRNCHVIELTVDAANADARRLYDGLGFLVTGQLHWYRLDL